MVLSIASIAAALSLYSQAGSNLRLVLVAMAVIGAVTLLLCLLQIYGYPRRSHALLVQTSSEMIIATNALHEGFKLRFLRDILSENVIALSDQERARWKFMEQDGYYPALAIRNPKKLLILRLCTMIFDDVFAVDVTNRWEHHESAATAEPSFSKGEMPKLRAWHQNN